MGISNGPRGLHSDNHCIGLPSHPSGFGCSPPQVLFICVPAACPACRLMLASFNCSSFQVLSQDPWVGGVSGCKEAIFCQLFLQTCPWCNRAEYWLEAACDPSQNPPQITLSCKDSPGQEEKPSHAGLGLGPSLSLGLAQEPAVSCFHSACHRAGLPFLWLAPPLVSVLPDARSPLCAHRAQGCSTLDGRFYRALVSWETHVIEINVFCYF